MHHQANQISWLVPPTVTSGESVERPRQWADGRCLSAEQLGVYRRHTPNNGASRRQVNRTRPVSDSEDLRE